MSAFAAILIAVSVCLPKPAFGLDFSLGPRHYAEALEFYYRDPRPGIIVPMLRSFGESGLLANGEKRMFVAAFLATLASKGALDLNKLVETAQGRDARLTLAWAVHLSPATNEDALFDRLLDPADALFAGQIRNTPRKLAAWDPAWESSVLNMFWGAFMADGDPGWLDRIIDLALAYASGKSQKGQKAAASLYDYAPGHERIVKSLEQRLPRAGPAEKEMLETILDHAASKH